MKNKIYYYFLFLFLFNNNQLFSQPANDACADATPLTLGIVCDGTNTNATIMGATDEGTIPLASCLFAIQDIWYSFTTPTSGKIEILLSNPISLAVTELVLYSGTCGNLIEDTCASYSTEYLVVSKQLTPNTTYYLRINDFVGTGTAFCVQVREPIALSNDVCSEAIPLTVGALCDGETLNADHRFAQNEGMLPVATCNNQSPPLALHDIWFSFIAPSSGQVVISVEQIDILSSTEFTVYGGGCSNLQEWKCPLIETIESQNVDVIDYLTPNEVYYLRASIYDEFDGKEFCIQIKEKIGIEHLSYDVSTSHNGIGSGENNKSIYYNREGTPMPLELDEIGTCEESNTSTMFARVEPAGIIKLKSTSGFCPSGFQGPASASGNWELKEYQLRGLDVGTIPITFTFEFSGTIDILPNWIGCNGFGAAGADFSFDIYFYESNINSDTVFQDQVSGNIYYGWSPGSAISSYEMNNVAVNAGSIRTLPGVFINDELVDINPYLATFLTDYNNLPSGEKNNPNLTLSDTFLSAIQDTLDLTTWDTTFQKSLIEERANFLNALNHLNYGNQIGYNPATTIAEHLQFRTKLNFDYKKEVTVSINNENLIDNSRLALSFGADVGTDNFCNPHTSTIDFTNTARLINISVPEEYKVPDRSASLYVGSGIEFPIESKGCTNAPITLSNTAINTGEYVTPDTLKSASIIEEEQVVTFKSEKAIILTSGFHAQTGSQFSAIIAEVPDCDENISPEQVSIKARTASSINNKTVSQLIEEEVLQLSASPNPFNNTTTIQYYLPKAGRIQLQILDMMGTQVALLEENTEQVKGLHQLNYQADFLRNGTYFIVIQSEGYMDIQKLIFIR